MGVEPPRRMGEQQAWINLKTASLDKWKTKHKTPREQNYVQDKKHYKRRTPTHKTNKNCKTDILPTRQKSDRILDKGHTY